MTLRAIILSLGIALGLTACGPEPVTPEKTTATVEISDLYFTLPSPGRDRSGGGMKITATGGDFRLVSSSAEGVDRVELHTMSMENDMMQMRKVDGIDITDGETVSLAPGGPHLMLFGVDQTFEIGQETEMLFTFETGEGETVTLNYKAQIRSIDDL